jgi:hypothetical protein
MNNNRKLSVSGGLEMENTAMAISPLHSSTAANNPASQQPEQNASQKQQQQLQNAVKPCEDSYHEVKRTINHLLKRSLSGRTTTTTTSSGSNTKPLVNTDLDIIRIIESSTRIHYSLYKFQSEVREIHWHS